MLLAIDARPLARGKGGIQRYLEKILPYLANDSSFKVILYSDKPIDCINNIVTKTLTLRHAPYNIASSLTWHLYVSYWASIDQPDIFWSPRHHLPFILPKKTKRVVTIHDFVWKTYPSTMPKLQRLSEKVLMPFAIKKATKIICISQTTQSQLNDFFPSYSAKGSVILHGAYKSKKIISPHDIKTSGYFLCVGTLEPRKNYTRLIHAFDNYATNGGKKNLIIVGKYGWRYAPILEALNQSKNSNRIQILQEVTDRKLLDLYSRACGFVSPSLDEGYGLPPQEAMRYSLPLLLSDIGVYRELYSDANLWADPLSINELVSGLHELEKLPKKNFRGSNKSDHSWQDCATQHIAIFLGQ